MTTVKYLGETDTAWLYEGLAVPFGGPADGQDLTGSHFTKDTDLCLDWFPVGGRPVLYGHGFDGTVKRSVVGRETGETRVDESGRWVRLQIDKAKQYAAMVRELAEQGVLALSTGAVDHLVQIATKSGEIKVWPWVELSLVPNPANPEALIYRVKSADAIRHMGVLGVVAPHQMVDDTSDDGPSENVELADAPEGDPQEPAEAPFDSATPAATPPVTSDETTPDVEPASRDAQLRTWLDQGRALLDSGPAAASLDGHTTVRHGPIQMIHDAARALGASCKDDNTDNTDNTPGNGDDNADKTASIAIADATGKGDETSPANVLAVKAGDDAEPVSEADLATIKATVVDLAIAEARRLLVLD